MSRVVHIGDCTLIEGDCAEILPTLGKFDACVTDPPYGLGNRMHGGTWGAARKYADMRVWDEAAPDLAFLLEAGAEQIIWGGNYFPLPPSRCWLSWSKINSVPTMAAIELAWTNLDMPSKEWRGPVGVHDTGHPTQKPLQLMQWTLGHLRDSHSIIDPFMGSGTTGVACAHLGLKFTGVEREPRYFDIACRRIEEAYRQPRLFAEPQAKPKQEALL